MNCEHKTAIEIWTDGTTYVDRCEWVCCEVFSTTTDANGCSVDVSNWYAFGEMMKGAGWKQGGINSDAWYFGEDIIYYPRPGVLYINDRNSEAGDWTKFLAAGETPAPF